MVVNSEHSTDDALDRSTLAEIEMKIELGKRNAVSRLFHAKNDREMIAAWKSDLSRVLHIFNVSFLISARLSLNVHSQTELAINTNVTVSDIRRDVAATHTVVSDVRNDVTSTHAIVSDIHRTITENQRGADGNNQSVSLTCTPLVTEQTLTVA
jgi:hypothetical protein